MAGITAESIGIFFQTFGIIALAEFGDKTQLAALAFAARYKPALVMGCMVAGFAVADGLAVMAGMLISESLNITIVKTIAGAVFIGLGIWTLVSKEEGEDVKIRGGKSAAFAVFATAALMEMGDKTQLYALSSSAATREPLMVFLGTVGAMALMTALGILAGSRIAKYAPKKYIKIGAGALFILFGVLALLQAFGVMGA